MSEQTSDVVPDLLPFTMRNIYFRNTQTKLTDQFDPLTPGQQLSAIFRTTGGRVDCRNTKFTNGQQEETIQTCAFTTGYEFAYLLLGEDGNTPPEEDQEKAIVARISAEITVDYIISTPERPEPEALNKWAAGNVILHAWPYWREYCQNAMLRMSLPVTTIPLMQIRNHP